MSLKGVTPPRLPVAPATYDPQYMDDLLRVLRLYLNLLSNPGPIQTSMQRSGAQLASALSCVSFDAQGAPRLSLPTQADFAELRSGDIYCDTSGGVATSYPLRIKA